MSATIIHGKEIASEVRQDLAQEITQLKSRGITPGLAVILVGDNPASHSYVRGKAKACAELGIYSIVERVAADVSESELLSQVTRFNQDPAIHGILVQLPLPAHISERKVIDAIDPAKDVDGFHPINIGRLQLGLDDAFVPCTPAGIIEMMDHARIDIKGKHAVVVGRSNIVGKPMAQLLLQRDATVSVCHSKTPDLRAVTLQGDILIAAVGRPAMITADMVKPGAAVIDVGINRVDGKLVGDVDFEGVIQRAAWITPVPGGVGPMTITMLLKNTVEAAKRRGTL